MEIKIASNTPAIVKKILGNKTFSLDEIGFKDNENFTIDCDTSSFIDNSKITITNIETYYSDLGLLNPPLITSYNNNLNILKLSKDISKENMTSILETITDVKTLYDDISLNIENSTEASDYISKETYLLLALQSLVNMSHIISSFFNSSDEINICGSYPELKNLMKKLCAIISSVSNSSKSLYLLIGQENLSYNYALNTANELLSGLNVFDGIINNIADTPLKNILDNESLEFMANSIKNTRECLSISDNNIPTFQCFAESESQIINLIDSMLKFIISSSLYMSNPSIINLIYSITNTVMLINHSISAIDLSYSNVNHNYYLIVSNIKSALSFISSIYTSKYNYNLSKNLITDIPLNKMYSKTLDNENAPKSSQMLTPNFNFVLQDSEEKIENFTSKSNFKKDTKHATENNAEISNDNNSITKNIQLMLSFYVCNLNIKFEGTIGTQHFTGYIYYPNLLSLGYFEIDDLNVNCNVAMPELKMNLNINQCLTPKLNAVSITASSYNQSSPGTFSGSITFSFTVEGEILITALVPIVFAK
jgi:hypothetical protein